MSKPIHLFKQYAIERYGEPIFRIPLDMRQGCPNRAADGSGGCSFCPADGARAIQLGGSRGLAEQVMRAVAFARRRYKARRFMAYFQTFTNTWSPPAEQANVYEELLSIFPFDAISVGTRPDCLNDAVLDMHAQLNDDVEIWMDLGVQTVHDHTLERINRGHNWAASVKAIEEIAKRGMRTVAHVMLGLPGEQPSHFRQTAESLAMLPISAIKIHNLHVIKGTRLAAEFREHPFPVFDEYEYAELLIDFLRRTPAHVPVMRMTTDTVREELVAPRWIMKKGEFESYVARQMELREWRQGDLRRDAPAMPACDLHMDPVATDDGSHTCWNPDFNEHYHSPVGARTEAVEKYIKPTRLAERLVEGDVRLLDICFGLGYNALCAAETSLGADSGGQLRITALEIDRRAVGIAARQLDGGNDSKLDWSAALDALYRDGLYVEPEFRIDMHWGDARFTTRGLEPESYDIVFLDAFSTQRNSELWTLDFFRALRGLMKPNAVLATYCAALPVRGGLMRAGFHIGESIPIGRKRSGTVAALRPEHIANSIGADELGRIRNTTRGLPYRDPRGCWSNSKILRQRELARKSQCDPGERLS